MTTERSLLQKIREKELEINVQVDDARRGAEETIAKARKEAAEILKNAGIEAKAGAQDLTRREMETVTREIEAVRSAAAGEVKTLKEKGERNLPQAIEKITKVVALE
ncbi:MAG TPA: V-type ATPase subunit subunit G family protein [Methanomicrobiales archaeon]|nr:V-type ATPase subunit subunit G family protein [Methanomicrobiales archaeon]